MKQIAIEVSSHALDQDRAQEIHMDIAVFSNLTRDHLDYHGSMQKYADQDQALRALAAGSLVLATMSWAVNS